MLGEGRSETQDEKWIKECSAVTAVGVLRGLNPLVLLER
jgi:hypothetical protein